MTSLWRNREFNLLWGGQTLSELGSAVARFALPLLVLTLTGSAVQAGVVGTIPVGSSLVAGLSHVAASPFLRAVLMISAPLNFAITGVIFTIIVVLQRNGTEPAVIGLIETVIGVGGLAGAVVASGLRRRFGLAPLARMICVAATGLFLISALLIGGIAAAVPVAITLLLAPAANAALFGHLAATTPDHLQGRVISVIFLGAGSGAAVAPLLAGTLVTGWNPAGAMLVFTAAVGVSAVTALISRGLRHPAGSPADHGSGRSTAESTGGSADA